MSGHASLSIGRRRYSALHVTPGRRLSALVPDAVVRRLSTLGLATRINPTDTLVEQGKALCAQYMRSRCSGISGGGGGAKKIRWHSSTISWPGSRLVFPRLSHLGRHLERARPRLYAAIGRHAEKAPPSNELDPADLVFSIGQELFKSDITWGKVVSLMAVCGALAKGAASSGRTELMPTLLEAATAAMQGPLLPWLQRNGGWLGLVDHCQPIERLQPNKQLMSHSPASIAIATGSVLALILCLIFVLKYSLS